ncbi:MAG: 2-oxo acid dehydrogenase subunit E2 [Bacteroidales bacterium]|nr:MAG: 2-oxo acid dehydrogenase subunit E2 [Bacteroidales bacterium]
MAKYEIVMPKMGESVQEATITKWFKKEGERIEEDDVLLEIATDKVDTEIPSPVAGIIEKTLYKVDDVVPVGEVIAVIDMEGKAKSKPEPEEKAPEKAAEPVEEKPVAEQKPVVKEAKKSERFYSPLVKSIAQKENILVEELDSIAGSGKNGRVSKQDILKYIESKKAAHTPSGVSRDVKEAPKGISVSASPGDEIIQMDRIRKLTAEHMVLSKRISPHVSSFIEADVTNLVMWRNKVKDDFYAKEKHKLTYTPIFIDLTAKALKKFPVINASVDGDKIILRKNINIGVAVALPTGNLIVPVIKNAEQKNLVGLTVDLTRLADAARNSKLLPDDIQGGTFTISNFALFKNMTGTPIINQPQVAILGIGTIEKKPAVLETPTGDVIAIRHKMILSISYDHRIIDGAIAGAFILEIKNLLEQFDINTVI